MFRIWKSIDCRIRIMTFFIDIHSLLMSKTKTEKPMKKMNEWINKWKWKFLFKKTKLLPFTRAKAYDILPFHSLWWKKTMKSTRKTKKWLNLLINTTTMTTATTTGKKTETTKRQEKTFFFLFHIVEFHFLFSLNTDLRMKWFSIPSSKPKTISLQISESTHTHTAVIQS